MQRVPRVCIHIKKETRITRRPSARYTYVYTRMYTVQARERSELNPSALLFFSIDISSRAAGKRVYNIATDTAASREEKRSGIEIRAPL